MFDIGTRQRLALPQTHTFDATCVGRFQTVSGLNIPILEIKCTGRGSYQRTRLTAGGFPRGDGYGYSLLANHSGKDCENRGDVRRRALSLPGLKAEVSRAQSR